jgi:DNA-binding FadR family transcriptional regulator
MLQQSIARMHAGVQDAELFTHEARRFMSLVATASRNRVLALLVDALHRMSEGIGEWEERQRRSALRSYERVVEAIDRGEPDVARSVMAESMAAAVRHWERTAPDQLKLPVAWMASAR